jgi:DNA processing protein
MADAAWLSILFAAQHDRRPWLKALQAFESAAALLEAPARALAERALPPDEIARLKSPDAAVLARWQQWLNGRNRSLVVFGSDSYPQLLAATVDPPLALWVQGARADLLKAPQLAIVGSRNPTGSGRDTALHFARYLSERGLTITSGLAVGIDAASHRGALHALGRTVAVLGSGLDVIFPRVHERLAEEITEHGVLVSEYPPGVAPQKFHFPQRNRIIAGLSVGTLVVEATRRSGSLITARRATDYGREVFAIPGSIHNPLARGCHALIREGAKLVEEAGDIFVELAPLLQITDIEKVTAAAAAQPPATLDDPVYAQLLEQIDFAPTTIAVLIERVGLTAAEVSSMLLVLELEGFVEALPGGRYMRLAKRGS